MASAKYNYYTLLNIKSTATAVEVKRAYHKLAKQWHPDKNPTNKAAAETRFKEIREAYSVLSDAEKRRQYDRGCLHRTNIPTAPTYPTYASHAYQGRTFFFSTGSPAGGYTFMSGPGSYFTYMGGTRAPAGAASYPTMAGMSGGGPSHATYASSQHFHQPAQSAQYAQQQQQQQQHPYQGYVLVRHS